MHEYRYPESTNATSSGAYQSLYCSLSPVSHRNFLNNRRPENSQKTFFNCVRRFNGCQTSLNESGAIKIFVTITYPVLTLYLLVKKMVD